MMPCHLLLHSSSTPSPPLLLLHSPSFFSPPLRPLRPHPPPVYQSSTLSHSPCSPSVIAGAGTIGIEILEQLPSVDAVVVPVGGGGLIAGIALAIKTYRPDVMIIGVEPENAPSMSAAMSNGAPTEVQVQCTVADGLSVPKVGQTVSQPVPFHSAVTIS